MKMGQWECSLKQRTTDAALATDGLERRLLKHSRERMLDRDQAEAWAKRQPWYSRVVMVKCSARHWVWFLEPEGGR